MFKVTPLSVLNDSYVWFLHDPNSNQVAAVDPGDGCKVLEFVKREGLNLTKVLVTHHHLDHVQGIEQIEEFQHVAVYGPKHSPFKGITTELCDGDEIDLFGNKVTIISAEGHTLDHIMFLTDGSGPQLFCGDTLFSAGCGRLFEGSPDQMFATLNKIKNLPIDTLIYPAHEYSCVNLGFAKLVEPSNIRIDNIKKDYAKRLDHGLPTLPTSVGLELQINPFLRTGESSITDSLNTKFKYHISSELMAFTLLREWRDGFAG